MTSTKIADSIDEFVDECIKTDASEIIISYKGKFVYTSYGFIKEDKLEKICLIEDSLGIISREYIKNELNDRTETIHNLLRKNPEVHDTFDYPIENNARESRIWIISKREHQSLLESLKEKFQEN